MYVINHRMFFDKHNFYGKKISVILILILHRCVFIQFIFKGMIVIKALFEMIAINILMHLNFDQLVIYWK